MSEIFDKIELEHLKYKILYLPTAEEPFALRFEARERAQGFISFIRDDNFRHLYEVVEV